MNQQVKSVFNLAVACVFVIVGVMTIILAGNRGPDPVPPYVPPTTAANNAAASDVQTTAPATTEAPDTSEVPETSDVTEAITTEEVTTTAEITTSAEVTTTAEVTTAATTAATTTAAVTTTAKTESTPTSKYKRTVTLGKPFISNSDSQGGWETKGIEGTKSTFSVADFTSSKYLVLEFNEIPDYETHQNFGFAWRSIEDELYWYQNQYKKVDVVDNVLVIDLSKIKESAEYNSKRSTLQIYIWIDNMPWKDIPLKDAYFAD